MAKYQGFGSGYLKKKNYIHAKNFSRRLTISVYECKLWSYSYFLQTHLTLSGPSKTKKYFPLGQTTQCPRVTAELVNLMNYLKFEHFPTTPFQVVAFWERSASLESLRTMNLSSENLALKKPVVLLATTKKFKNERLLEINTIRKHAGWINTIWLAISK